VLPKIDPSQMHSFQILPQIESEWMKNDSNIIAL
jgi:hypothetical protein